MFCSVKLRGMSERCCYGPPSRGQGRADAGVKHYLLIVLTQLEMQSSESSDCVGRPLFWMTSTAFNFTVSITALMLPFYNKQNHNSQLISNRHIVQLQAGLIANWSREQVSINRRANVHFREELGTHLHHVDPHLVGSFMRELNPSTETSTV